MSLDMVTDNDLRWNEWTRVYHVLLPDECIPKPRRVRLTQASARAGDPIEVSDGGWVVVGVITRIEASISRDAAAGESARRKQA